MLTSLPASEFDRRIAALSDDKARVRGADMNDPWLAHIPVLRGWLAGHVLRAIRRAAR